MRPDTNFTPLAGPYCARRRRATFTDAIAQGAAVVLALLLHGIGCLLSMPVRFVLYLLGPKP